MDNLSKLIETIRREEREKVLAELVAQTPRPATLIQKYLEQKINELMPSMTRNHTYKLQMALYTIVRFGLDLKNIAHLQPEQVETAMEIIDAVMEIVGPSEAAYLGN